MYRIAVLTNSGTQEAFWTEQISRFRAERGLFPKMEHLRTLCPKTRIIWCCDLDFSLHAFRLRADYFLLEPVTEAALQQGFRTWLDEKNPAAQLRPDHNEHNRNYPKNLLQR